MRNAKIMLIVLCLVPVTASGSYASTAGTSSELIDLNKLITIESSWNPSAKNRESGAIGLCQITQICLQEWNNFHPREKYTTKQLYDPQINMRIGYWYVNDRIPKMLKAYELPDTSIIDTTNLILMCYNWGIGNVLKYKKGIANVPCETKNYIKKYWNM